MTELPGLDLRRLEVWLDRNRPGLRQGELSGRLLTGGKSNLTYRLTDGVHAWALRRPPLGHVLPTAHDMAREFRVISALRGTGIPVAGAVVLGEDPEVATAPFYLMDFVDGRVLSSADDTLALSPQEAVRTGELLVDTLAALHVLDPESVGLADFGRPAGFLERQLKRWHQQWRSSETRPLDLLQATVDRLSTAVPDGARPAIVHGDFRLANTIFTSALDRIAAVIDWEMATVGDPLTDLGVLMVYQSLAADGDFGLAPLRPVAGHLTAAQMAERYRTRSSRDLGRLNWYIGFGFFKLAVISETIRHRHLAGKTVGAGFDRPGDDVPAMLEAALQALSDD
ncbi:acyl-CoA dehydrogenase [Planotetraspora silvatica]|uniref:Acyl-CoA dehydrogenase n=1 Tax=Planotetraspora silvatica TaxID=234614 RepID=A0A8J3UQV4_9ACTN|nr:phosphotransferase family protein [Planotetraspora silvatica]GII50259.1 acyl-CoA dehydrogenase [Planotetraspora silvatica]